MYRKSEAGFFLPFVLFVFVLVSSSVLTTVAIYQNELKVSARLLEQIKAETMVQMSTVDVKERLNKGEIAKEGRLRYHFPQGKTSVHYKREKEQIYRLYIEVLTEGDEAFQMEVIVEAKT